MQEAWIRRLDQNTIPTVCLALLLTHDTGPDGWDALRAATVEALEERTEDAITVMTQATGLGWNAPIFKVTQNGPAHSPSFEAQGTIVLPDTERVRYFSVHVVCETGGSAKFVKQRAAVELLRNIVNRKEGSSLVVRVTGVPSKAQAPKVALVAPPPKKAVSIDLGKNPVSMLMEVSQAETVKPPEFAVTQSGPPHSPTFRCLASFKHYAVEVTAGSKQAAKTEAARKLVEKLV
jgi:dsRNA-specific ribonuclease